MRLNRLSLTIFALFFASVFCLAQNAGEDAIYLNNGNIIRGKIIGKTQNNSLKIQTTSGDTYVFNYSDIVKVEIVNVNDSLPEVGFKQSQIHKIDSLQKANLPVQQQAVQKPEPIMSKYAFDKIRDEQLMRLMSEKDYDLYRQFRSSANLGRTGTGLIKSGVFLSVIGCGGLVVGGLMYNSTIAAFGFIALVSGDVLLDIGIPIAIVSVVRRNVAKNVFYEKYYSEKHASYAPTLHLKVVPNGVGLALNF